MKVKEIIKYLHNYQKWRRGADLPTPNPQKLGMAIDGAIRELRNFQRLKIKLDKEATECKCCVCGKQAVEFLLAINPAMPAYPYCRECFSKEKMKMIVNIVKSKERRVASRMSLNVPGMDVENENDVGDI